MHVIILLTIFLCFTVCAMADDGGYLFATFKGESLPAGEQVYFAVSDDGQAWQALNSGEPVLISTLGERGARDPFLIRAQDGKRFFLIATDCSIYLNKDWKRAVTAGSRSILVWQSDDLVHWSAARLVEVAPKDAGCTWAPEAVYDAEAGEYLVFFACTSQSDDFAKHRIFAVRTKDFVTFGEPFVYIEKPVGVIDTTIVHDGGWYYRFSKDETFKAINMETSPRLMGPWKTIDAFSLAKVQGLEGPECYRLRPTAGGGAGKWCLVVDQYAIGAGYKPFVTSDLSTGQFDEAPGFTFPYKFRHGSILPISGEELARLKSLIR